MPKTVTLGRNQRLSFSKIEEIQSMPNLIEVSEKILSMVYRAGPQRGL